MSKLKVLIAVGSACAMLSGCYVVPNQPYANAPPTYSVQPMQPVAPAPRASYTARLYPVNNIAAQMGTVTGLISNPEKGYGQFTFSVGGESYTGEATREPGSSSGRANAAGSRGSFAKCEYAMTSSSLGNGTCVFSTGARFEMHISL